VSLLAAIAAGHDDAADVAFLVAVILATLAAIAAGSPGVAGETGRFVTVLGWLAVAVLSLGWLLL